MRVSLSVVGQKEIPGHHPQLHGGPRHRARHQHCAPAQLCQEPRHPERPGPAVPPQRNQGQWSWWLEMSSDDGNELSALGGRLQKPQTNPRVLCFSDALTLAS